MAVRHLAGAPHLTASLLTEFRTQAAPVWRAAADPGGEPACPRADTRLVLRQLWWILGLAIVVGGVAMALSTPPAPADFGWFASTPSSRHSEWHLSWGDPLDNGSVVIVSRWALAGYGLVGLGVAIFAAGIGFQLGRRRANPTGANPDERPD